MIELINLKKSFNGVQVLFDVSAKFEKGKCNLIIGQSGSGKTVTMKSIVGLVTPERGQILYDGRDFLKLSRKEKQDVRKEMGMVFQGGALFDSMTVEDNVIFPLTMFTDMSYDEKRERANFCLNRVALENANNLLPSELSGGMKKRVAIARAISANPKYLFCDEPNSGLDPKTSALIDELIREITLEYNTTTIINTHDMNSMMQIGDNICFIYQGHSWWTGSKNDILETENPELLSFLEASELTKNLIKR